MCVHSEGQEIVYIVRGGGVVCVYIVRGGGGGLCTLYT